jgi:hypothetical protein
MRGLRGSHTHEETHPHHAGDEVYARIFPDEARRNETGDEDDSPPPDLNTFIEGVAEDKRGINGSGFVKL